MTEKSGTVVLPCSTEDFGSFISSLLGKPQTMANFIRGPFELSKDDVLNLHVLLSQRIAQQNEAVLTQFTAKLLFDDDSSVLLDSVDDFSSYNEVRPVACTGLHVSWVFLVKFKDKSYPEKQQIDVSFLTSVHPLMIDREIPVFVSAGSMTGHIEYRIAHTARTWGSDIDALIGSHLKGVVDDIPASRKWLSKHGDKLSIFTFCFLLLSAVVAVFVATTDFVSKQREVVENLPGSSVVGLVSPEQISYLLDLMAAGTWERTLLISSAFLLLSLVVSILVAVWVGSTADNLPPSFLLLTKESVRRKKRILAKRQNKWFSFLSALAFGAATGVVGNILYAIWFAKLVAP